MICLADKIKEYEDTTRLDNLNRELSGIEVDFGKIKGDVARRLQNLKFVFFNLCTEK